MLFGDFFLCFLTFDWFVEGFGLFIHHAVEVDFSPKVFDNVIFLCENILICLSFLFYSMIYSMLWLFLFDISFCCLSVIILRTYHYILLPLIYVNILLYYIINIIGI